MFHLITVILRSGKILLEVRDILMFWTVVASSLLKSESKVELKTMAKHVG